MNEGGTSSVERDAVGLLLRIKQCRILMYSKWSAQAR